MVKRIVKGSLRVLRGLPDNVFKLVIKALLNLNSSVLSILTESKSAKMITL